MKVLFTNTDKSKQLFYKQGFDLLEDKHEFVAMNKSIKGKMKFEVTEDTDADDAIRYSSEDPEALTVSVTEGLYIDGLDEDRQPGINYKMPFIGKAGQVPTDEDIANYYAGIVKDLGGTANAKLVDNVTVAYKGNVIKEFKVENPATLTSKVSKTISKGNPLYSITLIPEFGDIHRSECDNMEVEFLHETRDAKVLKKIASEFETITKGIEERSKDEKDFLGNEVH